MTIWRWASLIDPVPESARVSLGEGNTPLIRSRRIGPLAGLDQLYFKLEYGNPTGSYKDRFAAAAISHMLATERRNCIATSSGNTGSSLAAYCTAAGITCRIAIVDGAPLGKLKQMLAYGAGIARIREFGIDAEITTQVFRQLKHIGRRPGWSLEVSAFVFSPVGMSGVQTISYELAEQSDGAIDHVFCPAGGGGLCVAVARGFRKLVERGELKACPAVHCVQPEGNNTISGPLNEGLDRARAVSCTPSVSGLQVASVVDGDLTIQECRATRGVGHLVTDQDVWNMQKRLAREEGVFSEPAGAVALTAAILAAQNGLISKTDRIICLVTGSGFKDDSAVERLNSDTACGVITSSDLDTWAQ